MVGRLGLEALGCLHTLQGVWGCPGKEWGGSLECVVVVSKVRLANVLLRDLSFSYLFSPVPVSCHNRELDLHDPSSLSP